jgi:hypothetical protein
MKTIALIGAGATVLGACASSPIPADKLAQSQAAVRSAQEVGAERVPTAALHLKVANDQLDMAKKLIQDGDTKRAEYMLMRAEADAEAAIALAREASARADAQRTLEEVQQIKNSRPEGS